MIVSDDSRSGGSLGLLNGRAYRMGYQLNGSSGTKDGTVWKIAADPQNSDFETTQMTRKKMKVLVVGRGADPDQTASKMDSVAAPLAGSTQDIGMQTIVVSFPAPN